MLFTEQDLYVNNGLNILDEATYLSEDESLINPQTIPVKEVSRLGYGVVRFDDVDSLAESYGIDYIDAMYAIAESSNMNPEYLAVSVPEEDIIAYPEIVNELANIVVQPLSENDIEYQLVISCLESFFETGDEDYLDGLLLEAIIDLSNLKPNAPEDPLLKAAEERKQEQQKQQEEADKRIKAASNVERFSNFARRNTGKEDKVATTLQHAQTFHDLYAHSPQKSLDKAAEEAAKKVKDEKDKIKVVKGSGTGRLPSSETLMSKVADLEGQVKEHKKFGQKQSDKLRAERSQHDTTTFGLKNAIQGGLKEKERADQMTAERDAERQAHIKTKQQETSLANALNQASKEHEAYRNKGLHRAADKLYAAGNWVKNNKGKTALGVGLGAAAIGGGIYAYKQYKNKPKSVIAKRIAALRGIYKKFMNQVRKNPQKANIFKRAAAKVLSVIDKLMGYLQNAAG